MNFVKPVPVVTVFARHSATCKYSDDERSRRCDCCKHIRWTQDGKQYRCSAKTRSWPEAEEATIRPIERLQGESSEMIAASTSPPQTIHALADTFVNSKQSQGLNQTLVRRYQRELTRLANFLMAKNIFLPRDITASSLYKFRETWAELYPAATTQQKAQERVRAFLRFLHDDGHIAKIPRLSPIKARATKRMPLDLEKQYPALLNAIPKTFPDSKHAARIRSAVRLMRHTGLSIQDAVTLVRDRLQFDDNQKVYRVVTARQKTGTHVSLTLNQGTHRVSRRRRRLQTELAPVILAARLRRMRPSSLLPRPA